MNDGPDIAVTLTWREWFRLFELLRGSHEPMPDDMNRTIRTKLHTAASIAAGRPWRAIDADGRMIQGLHLGHNLPDRPLLICDIDGSYGRHNGA